MRQAFLGAGAPRVCSQGSAMGFHWRGPGWISGWTPVSSVLVGVDQGPAIVLGCTPDNSQMDAS